MQGAKSGRCARLAFAVAVASLKRMNIAVWSGREMRYRCGRGGAVVLLGFGAAYWLWHLKKRRELRRKAIAKREKEQKYISRKLNELGTELDEEETNGILQLSGPELLARMQNSDLDPVKVLKTYVYKACRETQELNCVTEVLKESEEEAARLKSKDPTSLPLYGIPISLKESIKTKGTPSAGGMAVYIDDIPIEDSVIAQVLKHCGAVPFVKTNTPQVMVSYESSNPIYGETSNPLNHEFAPGGSSAGESAIICAGASILGMGTDIAGSIRLPAHFTGICGLKVTRNRISLSGLIGSVPGQTAISSSIGPMARDVDTLVMAMRALLCDKMFELDRCVPRMMFNEEVYSSRKPLRIGYYDDDGYMKPVPACRRAVRITKEALESAGHTLVPYKIPDIEKMMEQATRAFYMDGGKTNTERLKYDVVDKRLLPSWRRWNIPDGLRRLYAFFMRFHSRRMSKDILAYGGGDRSVYELWKLQTWISSYTSKFWVEWREKYKIDALICPVFPLVACPKGEIESMTELMSYSTPYTLTNCPAGTVTVTKVTEQDIKDLEHHQGHYNDKWDRHVQKACKSSINMPVGVQCVTPPWKEELCLRLMKEVETLLAS